MNRLCRLCQLNKKQCNSHLIPKFIAKWIKDTSATGRFRSVINPGIPYQDISKQPLLCTDCENRLSKHETWFANNIFKPYVMEELDSYGCAQGKIKTFSYDENLLKFILSIQWRLVVTRKKSLPPDLEKYLLKESECWRKYLMNESSVSGTGISHLIFLQNLASADGPVETLPKGVNQYILRAIDGTPLTKGKREVSMYSKIGPIILLTAVKPVKIKNMSDTRVKKNKGIIPTAQKLGHEQLNKWLFIQRPEEIISKLKLSESDWKSIERIWNKDPQKSKSSMTANVSYSDMMMHKGYKLILPKNS